MRCVMHREAGQAHVEANYSLKRVVDMWEELYMKVPAPKGGM